MDGLASAGPSVWSRRYNPLMIITGHPRRFAPNWYLERVCRRAAMRAQSEPGFHRFIVKLHGHPAIDTGRMVNPDAEPDIRRILSRALVLDPPILDEDPYTQL